MLSAFYRRGTTFESRPGSPLFLLTYSAVSTPTAIRTSRPPPPPRLVFLFTLLNHRYPSKFHLQWLALPLHIREVSSSNLVHKSGFAL